MKRIKIFLASSVELKSEREQFEIEIYRKCKTWFEQNVFLHLEIWEDLSAFFSKTRSQDEYNAAIKECDIFVLLVYTKLGNYSKEEFETAVGAFKQNKKPFILTYFKNCDKPTQSVTDFKNQLQNLEHFYCPYTDFNDLWKQFDRELDRLLLNNFDSFEFNKLGNKTYKQQAEKIYNIDKIDNATFN